MAVVPYTFAGQTGQIPLSELDVNFANVKAFAETAGNVTGNIQSNITAVGTLTSLTVAGNVTAPFFLGNVIGNISGNLTVAGANTQVVFNDNGVANAVAGLTFNKATGLLSVVGNVTAANVVSTGQISATGNISCGSLNAVNAFLSGSLSAAGNITINNINAGNIRTTGFISAVGVIEGNGVFTTNGNMGTPPGVTDLNIGNVNPSVIHLGGNCANIFMANVNSLTEIRGNLQVGGFLSATGNITTTGLISATGNINVANVLTTGLISATGNITGGNITTAGSISATGNLATSGLITATGNIVGGNLSIGGTSTLTGVATAPTAANGVSNTQVATTAFVGNAIKNYLPSGVILMWSGTVATIPTGWLLCDGTSGTPDLRNRFIVGAGSTYTPGNTGGSADAIVVSHTHGATSSVSDPGHAHSYTAPVTGIDDAGGFLPDVLSNTTSTTSVATTGISVTTSITSTGTSGTNANLPPYYALAYIMKA